jgi:hypothetical protein
MAFWKGSAGIFWPSADRQPQTRNGAIIPSGQSFFFTRLMALHKPKSAQSPENRGIPWQSYQGSIKTALLST